MPRFASYGFIRDTFQFPVPNQILAAAGALDIVTAFPPGFAFTLEKIIYVAHTVHTGGGATKTFTIKRNSTSAGTVVVPVASVGTNGLIVAGTVTASAADWVDADTLTISANAGTAFTLGAGDIALIFRQKAQKQA